MLLPWLMNILRPEHLRFTNEILNDINVKTFQSLGSYLKIFHHPKILNLSMYCCNHTTSLQLVEL
jgi:hypothetical protein